MMFASMIPIVVMAFVNVLTATMNPIVHVSIRKPHLPYNTLSSPNRSFTINSKLLQHGKCNAKAISSNVTINVYNRIVDAIAS